MPRFDAIADRKLVFRGSQPQRADHHRRQSVGELALEHRTFARNHAVISAHLAKQDRWVDIGQMYLPRAFEISLGAPNILLTLDEDAVVCFQNMMDRQTV